MPRHPFSVLLERKFLEWQIKMGERKSQEEFAKLLGVKRASLTMWMNGDHLPELDNAHKIAKVLGNEVYDALDLPRPDPYLQSINSRWDRIPPDKQQKLAELAEHYEAETNDKNTETASKRRKTSTD